ncbi:MAG: hypothetical protein AB7Q97_19215 [Gammaproteobacteria bacterium]
MRDSASMWISDARGRFGLPRLCIEAVAAEWGNRGVVGGQCYEQLFRCRGALPIEGDPAIDFDGTGLFVRRTGVRDIGDFPGHVWQSALFPSGRAFGLLGFPPRADGTPAYNEAFIFENGRKTYASLFEGAWMTTFVPNGGEVGCVLQAEDGRRVRIGGRTHDSTCVARGQPMFGGWTQRGVVEVVALPFHQGGALYEWDGERTYGMIERSYPADRTS